MSSIKNVVVVGAGGNLGPSIVKALVDTGFTVTVLTRSSSTSTSTFPSSVHVEKTDYSPSSLAEILKGKDAVVSTIATAALATQSQIIQAAAKAGVQRFIPSEFGLNTQRVKGGAAKILSKKVEVQDELNKLVAENPGFSWTGISTNLFFDWGLKVGSLGFSIPTKTATIWDSGNEPFTATNLYTIGLAVSGVLKHPKETANRYLDVGSFVTTQNEILKLFEEESGEKWSVEHKKAADSLKTADEKLSKGDYSAFRDYLAHHFFADGEGQSVKEEAKLANGELGVPFDDLRATIKAALAS